jgi:oligosaccharyltransferase complex subunit delta (ribophorin II)
MKLSLLLVVPLISAVAGQWSVQNGQLNAFNSGKQISSNSFDESATLSLDAQTSLEVTFDTLKDGKGVQAHQTVMALSDLSTGLEFFFPATVRPNGKAKLSITPKKIPRALHGKPLDVSILVGSFGKDKSVEVHAGSKVIVPSSQEHKPPVRLGPKPEIHHQFRASPRTVSAVVALVFAGAAAFTTVVLFGYWASVGANINSLSKALSDAPVGHVGLIASLASLETVFILYYLGRSIFDTLWSFAIIAPIIVFTGSRALRDVRERRESK